ncbi:hypothetical protein AVEN_49116-1 [Araneus ventricosus]|uniref:DUF4817 domain-containing protein n=1 Tax=Araneus ventricosus TaxID=182803 RepID=A0A4Y2C0J3_ARAVE|nr:hypothetical protein AVEN_49116-1 [Araneus ventricosus]
MRYYGALNLLQREIPNASIKMSTVYQKARLWFEESKSIVTVQRCFCLEYRNSLSPSRIPSSVGMSNLEEQEMCIVGKVLDDHRSVVERVRETLTP